MKNPARANTHAFLLGSASVLALAAAPLGLGAPAFAQDDDDVIVVTGTRRAESVQDIPVNIAALGGAQIEQQGIGDLTEIASWVPGVFIVDQGARSSNQIVFRGLNADPIGSGEGVGDGNNGGGTVGTYLGEIPFYVELRLNDMERVEFLIGPQGTLYGAGTLGGAVRYIPNRPDFSAQYFNVRGDAYSYGEGDGISTDLGFTANLPISDNLAIRGSLDFLNDTGFIDQPFVVREIGVSNPDVIFDDQATFDANLRNAEDTNTEETLSGRIGLRWQPTSAIDANLTYYYQDIESGGRQISSWRSTAMTERYQNAKRVLEPNDRENELLALEIVADLGFAELTSATGYSEYSDRGQRDQNDLLITLEYSYEAFPAFTAYTLEERDDTTFNQEVRLVSTSDGPLSWIVGGFYNDADGFSTSSEFTPGYDQFAVDNFGGVQLRPDSLEYYSVSDTELTEKAIFGELGYDITDRWNVTVGARYYEYELSTLSSVDFPLLNTVFFGDPPDQILTDFEQTGQEDDGILGKFNTSYQFTDDILGYFTVSEGYRIGDNNGLAPCPDPIPPNQGACALPFEEQYFPDSTTNYEVGARTQWFGGDLTVNGAVYFIDWTDPQVSSATVNANIPITINGSGAESKGLELFFDAQLTDNFSLRGNYGYNNTELTEGVPNLIRTFPISDPAVVAPGEICIPGPVTAGNPAPSPFASCFDDGEAGDRLPGYPEHQFSLFANYNMPFAGGYLDFDYSVTAISEVLTRTGGRGDSLTLDSYDRHNIAVSYSNDAWTVTGYVNNLFDSFDEAGAISTQRANQHPTFDIN
ncbi:MAG: TonB-dependent receptor, partial [Maricaulaceae bacterium]